MKCLLIGACALLLPASALAATCGGLNPVIATTTPLAFGNYSPASLGSTNANATITTACTVQFGNSLPSFTIGISAGNSNSFSARQMNFLTAKLNYNIYTSAAFDTIWGDGTSSTVVQSYNSGAGASSQPFTAFGSIPNNQFVTAGLFGDTLTITVTY